MFAFTAAKRPIAALQRIDGNHGKALVRVKLLLPEFQFTDWEKLTPVVMSSGEEVWNILAELMIHLKLSFDKIQQFLL